MRSPAALQDYFQSATQPVTNMGRTVSGPYSAAARDSSYSLYNVHATLAETAAPVGAIVSWAAGLPAIGTLPAVLATLPGGDWTLAKVQAAAGATGALGDKGAFPAPSAPAGTVFLSNVSHGSASSTTQYELSFPAVAIQARPRARARRRPPRLTHLLARPLAILALHSVPAQLPARDRREGPVRHGELGHARGLRLPVRAAVPRPGARPRVQHSVLLCCRVRGPAVLPVALDGIQARVEGLWPRAPLRCLRCRLVRCLTPAPRSFKTPPAPLTASTYPLKFGIIADIGQTLNTSNGLQNLANQNMRVCLFSIVGAKGLRCELSLSLACFRHTRCVSPPSAISCSTRAI